MAIVDEDRIWNSLGPLPQAVADRADGRTLGARELYELFRRRLLLISAIVLAGTAGSFLVAEYLPKTYTARSMIVVESDDPNPLDNTPTGPTQQPDKSRMDTEADLIASRVFAGRVVDSLNLMQDPDFNTYLPAPAPAASASGGSGGLVSLLLSGFDWAAGKVLSLLPGGGDGPAGPLPPLSVQHDRAISSYLSRLSVDRSGESLAMTVSFFDDDPAVAARIANATANLFVEWSRDNKRQDIKDAVGFLRQQAGELAARIASIEVQIAGYAKAHGVSSDPRDDLLRASIQQSNEQLSTARGDLTQAQARLAQIRQEAAAGGPSATADPLLSSPFLTTLRSDEATALRDRAQLAGNYGRNHPLVQEADAKIATVRGLIAQEMKRIVANLENDVRVAGARVDELTKRLVSANEELRQRSLAEAKLRELNNDLATEQKLYELVTGRLGSLDPFSEAVEPNVRVVSVAEVPTGPSFPKLRLLLAGGFVGSLVLAFILVLTLESLDNRVRDPRRASKALLAPMLASIPELRRKFLRRAPTPLDTLLSHPKSAFADGFRSLYSGCRRVNVGQRQQVILVCSALPREGKTTTAMGLAVTSAMDGALTALIDLDLRTLSLRRCMKLGPAAHSFGDYLRGECELHQVMQRVTKVPQLDVLAPSADDRELPDFLNSGQLEKLMEALRLEYDVIIIDAPPVLVVEDAIRIAASADVVLLTAAFARTSQEAFSQAGERLRMGGGPLVGWVFNRSDPFHQARGAVRRSYFRRKEFRRYFHA